MTKRQRQHLTDLQELLAYNDAAQAQLTQRRQAIQHQIDALLQQIQTKRLRRNPDLLPTVS